MCLAALAARFPSLKDRPPLLQDLAHRWHLAEDALSPAQAGAPKEEPSAQRSHRGQPVDQDHGRRRKGAWLRRRREDQGAGWVRRTLGLTAEIVRHPKKPAPEEVMRAWVREWNKEGVAMDAKKFMPQKG